MPFFPGEKRKVPKARRGSPVPVHRVKESSHHSASKTGPNTNRSDKHSRGDSSDVEFDLDPEGDTTHSPLFPAHPSNYVDDGQYKSKMPRPSDRDIRPEIPRQGPRPDRRGEIHHAEMDPDRLADRMQSTMNFHHVPCMPIFEYCFLLRKHGISVRLGSTAARTMAQQGPISGPPKPANDDFSTDVDNPSQHQILLLDQAIAYVLSNGGEIEFQPLSPKPTIKCNACSERFATEREKENHWNRGRNPCQYCPQIFQCRALHEEHMRQDHKINMSSFQPHSGPRSDINWDGSIYERT